MSREMNIVKWMGGKSKFIDKIKSILEGVRFERFVDLFAGSMAVTLGMGGSYPMLVNDINVVLMGVMKEIRDGPAQLLEQLLILNAPENNDKDVYNQLRDRFNVIKFLPYTSETGALLIYLNKRCFNGLYRENQSGEFNASYREYKSAIYSGDTVIQLHLRLKNMNIQFSDGHYRNLLGGLKEGDLVYLDPPYYPCNTNCFTAYHSSGFAVKDQRELKDFCDELTKRGIKFLMSNAPCPEIRELYTTYTIEEFSLTRTMRSAAYKADTEDKSDSKGDNECFIRNF